MLAGSDTALSPDTAPALKGREGQQARGHAVHVESVPADEGFWVGADSTNRLWVQLTNTGGESDYQVKKGDVINFTGTIETLDENFTNDVGLTKAEGADQLIKQAYYVSVSANKVTLFH